MPLPFVTARGCRGGAFAAAPAAPAASVTSPVTRESDLVGWWKFDESSGTNAADSSDTGNDGTLANMTDADWVAGKNGNCLEFDGTNDHVAIAANAAFPSGDFTLSLWINRTAGGDTYAPLLESQGYTDAGSFILRTSNNNKLTFYVYNTTTGTYQWSITNTAGTWYHVAVVHDDSANGAELFYNASSLGTVNVGAVTIDDWNDNGLWIGRDRTSSYWKGLIDDVRIYNAALTSGDITDIYGSGDGDW